MATPYRQCSVSVLDTNDDPQMRFDDQGRSNYYHEYLVAEKAYVRKGEEGKRILEELAADIRMRGRGRKYDCILGLSGGVDSTYAAYVAAKLGLRPLAVHFDNGWNSELAVKNIENIVNRLGLDLITYVVDWHEFRDLQLAYLRASVVDIEVLTDHAIGAVLYQIAAKHGIRDIISGTNVVTEQVLPSHWIYNKTDHVNIRAIHRAYGSAPLGSYPFIDLKVKKYYQMLKGIRTHSVLNYVDYNKKKVKQVIADELGWRDYGGKHHESIFTRFYQGYILPTKFGIDKRKAHLSNLIFAGQMTKSEALRELEHPVYDPADLKKDYEYVLKKLELSAPEFEAIMSSPPRPHSDFEQERSIYERFPGFLPLRRPVQFISRLVARK